MYSRTVSISLLLLLAWACSSSAPLHGPPHRSEPVLASPDAPRMVAREERAQKKDFAAATVAGEMVAADGDDVAFHTEAYDKIDANDFLRVADKPLSTFSIDVDTASYANVRRFLREGRLPPADAVRIEEMINYFSYSYPQPRRDIPFAVDVEIASAPWNAQHRLARIGLKGREIDNGQRPSANIVFLIDVSGSMSSHNKLPLLKSALQRMVPELNASDRIAMVVYAGSSGLVLPSTSCDDDDEIIDALDRLRAGGSTNGGAGIQLAYEVAEQNFIEGGVNRVILATDGDFNVGVSHRGGLVRLVEEKAKGGVFLTVLGFGTGNYKDAMLEEISNRGNGNYAYVDTQREADKVLVDGLAGTLVTIAKDVKIQIEFNPAQVAAYRLIGYENRLLQDRDFEDDTKDAGEIGAGHTVTALYEIVPLHLEKDVRGRPPLKYQKRGPLTAVASSDELLTVKLRYKEPDGQRSRLLEVPVVDRGSSIEQASENLKLASAAATFGMLLRDSKHKGAATFAMAESLARAGRGDDPKGHREELIDLIEEASELRDE